ncbi:MAG: sugar O-acetyltransferase [Enterococcus hulanensis]
MNEFLGFEASRSGEMYDDLSPVFSEMRKQAVKATTEYNALYGKDEQKREAILRNLLGSAGESPFFEPDFRCEFGKNIHLGDRFFANFDCILLDGGEIRIGNDVLFGPRVGIFTTNHATDPEERVAGGCYSKNVVIEDNVWVGANVTINQGVTIGKNTIIGSGSVVTKNIPDNVIAVGNPCHVLREITEQDKTGYQSKRTLT